MSPVGSYFNDSTRSLYGSLGPFWYRGYHYAMEDRYPEITQEGLLQILSHFDVDRIVVGHTQYDSVSSVQEGRVIAIDVVVEELGEQQALVIEDGIAYRVFANGRRAPLD
jgi:hypothetical protein